MAEKKSLRAAYALISNFILFAVILSLQFLGMSLTDVLLILVAVLSLEIIYAVVSMHTMVRKHSKEIRDIKEDLAELGENVEEIGESLEGVGEDVQDISEDMEKEKERREDFELESPLPKIMAELETLKNEIRK